VTVTKESAFDIVICEVYYFTRQKNIYEEHVQLGIQLCDRKAEEV